MIYQEEVKDYLIHSSDFNKMLYIAELSGDYQDATCLYIKILIDQECEALAIFFSQGSYLTSFPVQQAGSRMLRCSSSHRFY